MMMALAAAMFCSCAKENNDVAGPQGQPEVENQQVELSFVPDALGTRSFYESFGHPEPWEKEIKTMYVYLYDSEGNFRMRREVTAAEISAKRAVFGIPNFLAGTQCTFYVTVNLDHGIYYTTAELDKDVNTFYSNYNSDFLTVTQGCANARGFIMTGKAEVVIAAAGQKTNIDMTLKRQLAKIAVRTHVDNAFTTAYNGATIDITNVSLQNVALQTFHYHREGAYPLYQTKTNIFQAPVWDGTYWQNLFYANETAASSGNNQVMLVLTGTFDADGDPATTDDQQVITYKVPFEASGDGLINRNAYYRLFIRIKGLSGEDVAMNISVAEWEVVSQEVIDIGI